MSLQELAENTVERALDRAVIIERWKGGPGRISLFIIHIGKLVEVPPRIYIRGIKLQRELKRRETTINSLVIGKQPDEQPREMTNLLTSLSDFLDIPVIDIGEAGPDYEAAMEIDSGKAQQANLSFFLLPMMVEVGPRITISYLVWEVS